MKVRRDEILDWMTYGERRAEIRADAMAAKEARRVHVGPWLTLLFENRDTIRYQIQEMVRVEQLVREADIAHEIATYNELLGAHGELGCTLLVEIEDPRERDAKLVRWLDVPEQMYVELESGERVRPRIDERQRSRGRLSTVQYLKFATDGAAPVAVGCDQREVAARTELTPAQRAALRADLTDAEEHAT